MLERIKDPPTMLVFGLYEGDRISMDVPIGSTVGDVKKMFQTKLNIYIDEMNRKDLKVLVLHYSGSDLEESWCFTDLGIPAGATIRVLMKEEVKPALYISCTYNQENIDIVDKNLVVHLMMVEDLRTIAGNKTGLPVSIFRLVTEEGREMYDGHQLYDYGVDSGATIRCENWDGWNEFINLCIMGFTPQVLAQISSDEVIGRFQLKVALFIAAHYGCADLARVLIKQGVRADEPIGVHPHKLWCTDQAHIETKKAAIHEATEQGQLNVLRLIVNHDITTIMAKDGNGLAALNIALRRSKKPCASFLLTRQWTRVPVGKFGSVTVQTLRSIKQWCEEAKEKAYIRFGPSKSTLKRTRFTNGPLVSHGEPVVDGFTKSPMTGKPKAEIRERDRKKALESFYEVYGLRDDPEQYFKQVANLSNFKNLRLQKNTKWGNVLDRPDVAASITQTFLGKTDDDSGSEVESKENRSAIKGGKKPEYDSEQGSRRGSFHGKMMRISTQASVVADSVITEEQEDNPLPPVRNPQRLPRTMETTVSNAETKRQTASKPAFMGNVGRNRSKPEKSNVTNNSEDALDVYNKDNSLDQMTKLPNIVKRSRKVSVAESTHDENEGTDNKESKSKSKFFQTPEKSSMNVSLPNLSTIGKEGPPSSPTGTNKTGKSDTRKSRKRKRITSAVLLSQAKAAEGAVPLPMISQENQSRPFFYHNGQREEDIVVPMMDIVSRHHGSTSRDRAIRSLTIANSFKEKPWLTQVRMALSLTSQSIRRSIKNSLYEDSVDSSSK